MEYNDLNGSLSTSIVEEASGVRPLGTDPYEPCPSLPEKFCIACYSEMPKWWERFFEYGKIGELCNGISNADERKICFRGIGEIAAPKSKYSVEETRALCKKMPSKLGEGLCRVGAAWMFFGSPHHSSFINKLCGELEEDVKSYCPKPKS